MGKKVKMVLYGEPGVGKSTFASKAPRAYFITTDGNYEWLDGAKEEDHSQVFSWAEAKKVFAGDFENYDTIVVDLLEDLFKWCEQEFCARNRIEHLGDLGFGKGYDITRNEFFLEISKLLAKDKNVILIMHGTSTVVKDRRGVEHTKYIPSPRLPDKVLDMIEGRVRYFLRCYMKAEETKDNTLIKKRYLSIVPKENEFGISRGIEENKVPHDIDLEWSEFAKWIDFTPMATASENKHVEHDTAESPKSVLKKRLATKTESQQKKEEPVLESPQAESIVKVIEQLEDVPPFDVEQATTEEVKPVNEPKIVEQPKPAVQSNEDKMAAIKAKLAALKAKNNK